MDNKFGIRTLSPRCPNVEPIHRVCQRSVQGFQVTSSPSNVVHWFWSNLFWIKERKKRCIEYVQFINKNLWMNRSNLIELIDHHRSVPIVVIIIIIHYREHDDEWRIQKVKVSIINMASRLSWCLCMRLVVVVVNGSIRFEQLELINIIRENKGAKHMLHQNGKIAIDWNELR